MVTTISKLKWLEHLEWHEGPLASLFQDNDGNLIVFWWHDVDVSCNYWIVFKTTAQYVASYKSNKDHKAFTANVGVCQIVSIGCDQVQTVIKTFDDFETARAWEV